MKRKIEIARFLVGIDKLIKLKKYQQAEKYLKAAVKALDNAKSKGLVHKNKVDREKSRLAKKVNVM